MCCLVFKRSTIGSILIFPVYRGQNKWISKEFKKRINSHRFKKYMSKMSNKFSTKQLKCLMVWEKSVKKKYKELSWQMLERQKSWLKKLMKLFKKNSKKTGRQFMKSWVLSLSMIQFYKSEQMYKCLKYFRTAYTSTTNMKTR